MGATAIPKGKESKHRKEEGWRRINGVDLWFYTPWHANYARFLDKAYDVVSKWLYKPDHRFKIGPCGYYIPTVWVQYVNGGSSWVEIAVAGFRDGTRAKRRPPERISVIAEPFTLLLT